MTQQAYIQMNIFNVYSNDMSPVDQKTCTRINHNSSIANALRLKAI